MREREGKEIDREGEIGKVREGKSMRVSGRRVEDRVRDKLIRWQDH